MASDGVALIAAERKRQVDEEGWGEQHDDDHTDESMAWAAACYAAPGDIYRSFSLSGEWRFRDPWPWERKWDKRLKHDRIRQLTIAGALIAAEIDRLSREAADEAQ